MKSKTGDLHALTRDTEILDPGSGNADAADTLDINDPAAATVEIADPDSKRHIVGGRSLPGSASAAGGYHILRKIGEGGMGIVYEAEQQHPRRLVALKVIRGGVYAGDYHVKMFEREIQALARLKHPGIVSIFEAGRFDDGQVFFAMELLQGRSLMEFVELKEIAERKPLTLEDKLAFFSRICEIVSYAHQRGVIHRDLKPQNIFVSDDSATNDVTDSVPGAADVKILDFGLARITDPDHAGATDVSQIGHVKGTLNYMSPEQLTGNPADVDVRSDIYALGVILYEMLSGHLPYELRKASVPEAMRIISQQPPEPLRRAMTASVSAGRSGVSRVDADVETIVMKALEKEPDRRYQSVAAMLDDVERFLRNQPILARPPSAFYQFRKLVTRHKAASASLAGLFLMLLAFGAVMVAQNARITSERDKAWMAQQTAEDQGFRAEEALEREQEQRRVAEKNLAFAEEQQKAAEQEKQRAEEARKSEQEQRLIAERSLKAAQTERLRAEHQTALAEKQEGVAREQKTLAEQRQLEAERQKALAEQREGANNHLLYASKMKLAQQAWERANVGHLRQILESLVPKNGQSDLRGFEWFYLWKQANNESGVFQPGDSTQPFDCSDFLNEGKFACSELVMKHVGQPVGSIKLLNENDGLLIHEIKGRTVAAVTPTGTLITFEQVTGTNNGYRIEKINSRSYVKLESIQLESAFLPVVSQTGSHAATIDDGRKLSIWSWSAEKSQRVITGVEISEQLFSVYGGGNRLAYPPAIFSPNGQHVLLLTKAGTELWDMASGSRIITFREADNAVIAGSELAEAVPAPRIVGTFSPDGSLLLLNSSGQTVHVWDVQETRKIGSIGPFSSIPWHGVSQIKFSRSGKLFALSVHNLVSVWEIPAEGKTIAEWKPIAMIKGHTLPITSFSFSAQDRSLITSSNFEKSALLWEISRMRSEPLLGKYSGFSASRDGTLAAVGEDGKIRIFSADTRNELEVFDESVEDSDPSSAVTSISPNGKYIAVTRRIWADGTLELWNRDTKKLIGKLGKDANKAVFSPDNSYLAWVEFADQKLTGIVWDVKANRQKFSFEGPGKINFLANGKVIVLGYDEGIRLLDSRTGEVLQFVEGIRAQMALAISPNEQILAAAFERSVILYDLRSRSRIGTLQGFNSFVNRVAFSPDGRRIVAGDPGEIKIWSLESMEELTELNTGGGGDHLLHFSADGRSLLVSNGVGVRIFEGASDAEIKSTRKK